MLTHRGFSAWIVCDGVALQEHLVAVDAQENRVSCWIPSEEGKTFSVYWKDHGSLIDSCAFVALDGFVVPGRFLFGSGVASRTGVRSGTTSERPFVFSKVAHSSPDRDCSKELGMITLRIKQVERSGHRSANPVQKIPDMKKGNRAVGDHCVGFGGEKESYAQYGTTWSVKPYASDGRKPSTHVSFIFRYRSREFLEAQGIVPDVPKVAKRAPVRRISSAPASNHGANGPITPSPSPSPKGKPTALGRVGSTSVMRPKPNSNLGITASGCYRETTRRVVTSELPNNYPGRGLLYFAENSNNQLGGATEADKKPAQEKEI